MQMSGAADEREVPCANLHKTAIFVFRQIQHDDAGCPKLSHHETVCPHPKLILENESSSH
jgi:hypothetical protein